MEITTKTIILAVISVILIAVILSGVFFLLNSSRQTSSVNKNLNPLARLGVITNSSPIPTPVQSGSDQIGSGPTLTPAVNSNSPLPVTDTQVVTLTNTKTYQGRNFIIKFPQKWGIVTCNNSQNFELDPYNSTDFKNYTCDRAIKPITVIVGNSALSCTGDTIKIGNNTVIRSKTETANWLKNRWCLNKNGMSFDITNRVAPSGIIGTGKDDFSSEIERIITSL